MAHRLFTSESVTEGHPDKVCDQISDAVLDDILAADPTAHVACETFTTTGMVVVMGEITTSRGQLLSWKYLRWVREHPVHRWACPIRILWGSGDNMTPRETVEAYTRRHSARLTVLEGGEHWFHTPEQLAALKKWEETES